MIHNCDLIDTFRHFFPTKLQYTWKKENPVKKARLDFFLATRTLTDILKNCKISPGYRTDHSMIELHLTINTFERGKGTWKFNCDLLRNIEYANSINNLIDELTLEYAIPVYTYYNILAMNKNEVQFRISDRLFFEMILVKTRETTIKFSSDLRKNRDRREEYLIKEIDRIEKSLNLAQMTDLLSDKKIQLQDIRNEKLKGNMIRSRAQWLSEGEKPTKFFCGLESKNFVNKTIKKLETDNGIITNQKEILTEVKNFYQNLFSNKDHELQDIDFDETFGNSNSKKLTQEDSQLLEQPITLSEVSDALKKMKNNKSPGSDGFPADFYKFFWPKLKHFFLRSLNETYAKKELPTTSRQCIISCLPKGEKPREFLKNWRPISLLNVSYKIISAALASRLKDSLNKIIQNTQSGFLPNRFIGESTRLVYDIMDYCEKQNEKGLLMLIDFEKAFDSVSWNFMYKAMQFLNFGDYMLDWVKILNNNITSSVQQCGFLSEPIQINRGCRQGDPIASLEFLVCGHFLCLLILGDQNIKGIKVKGKEHKLTQFADDTTLLLDGTQKSLQASLNAIEIFGTFSGLKMNKDKTKIIWLGRQKHSEDKLVTNPPLAWGEVEFDLLGLKFHVDLEKMMEINYEKYILQITDTIKHWNKRYLTPLGKITVIKTFIISKLIHLFTTLPTPEKTEIDKINNLLYKFVWDNKPDKVKREQINQNYVNGGLKMVNIEYFIKALKITWIRRLIKDETKPWATFFESTVSNTITLLEQGSIYTQQVIEGTTNPFWKSVLLAWHEYITKIIPRSDIDKQNSPLWNNPQIGLNVPFLNNWYENGIKIIGDIIGPNNETLSQRILKEKYPNITQVDFLTFFRIQSQVNNFTRLQNEETQETNFRPYQC